MNRHSIIRYSTILLTIAFLGSVFVFEQQITETASNDENPNLTMDEPLTYHSLSMDWSQNVNQEMKYEILIKDDEKRLLPGISKKHREIQESKQTEFSGDIWITGLPVKKTDLR